MWVLIVFWIAGGLNGAVEITTTSGFKSQAECQAFYADLTKRGRVKVEALVAHPARGICQPVGVSTTPVSEMNGQ